MRGQHQRRRKPGLAGFHRRFQHGFKRLLDAAIKRCVKKAGLGVGLPQRIGKMRCQQRERNALVGHGGAAAGSGLVGGQNTGADGAGQHAVARQLRRTGKPVGAARAWRLRQGYQQGGLGRG